MVRHARNSGNTRTSKSISKYRLQKAITFQKERMYKMTNNLGGFDETEEPEDFDERDDFGDINDNDFDAMSMMNELFDKDNFGESYGLAKNLPNKQNKPKNLKKPDISVPFENINIGDIITVVAAPMYEIPIGLDGFTMKEDTLLHNNIMLVTALELPFIGITNFSRNYTDVGYEKLVFNGYSEYKFFKLSDRFVKASMYSTRYKDLDKLRKEVIKNAGK